MSKKRKTKKIKKKSKKSTNKKQHFNHREGRDVVKTYVPGFDKLFAHGIPRGNSVLVEGGPGVGKTIFCLQVAMEAVK